MSQSGMPPGAVARAVEPPSGSPSSMLPQNMASLRPTGQPPPPPGSLRSSIVGPPVMRSGSIPSIGSQSMGLPSGVVSETMPLRSSIVGAYHTFWFNTYYLFTIDGIAKWCGFRTNATYRFLSKLYCIVFAFQWQLSSSTFYCIWEVLQVIGQFYQDPNFLQVVVPHNHLLDPNNDGISLGPSSGTKQTFCPWKCYPLVFQQMLPCNLHHHFLLLLEVNPPHSVPGSVHSRGMFGMHPPLPSQSLTTKSPAMGQPRTQFPGQSKVDPCQVPRLVPQFLCNNIRDKSRKSS